MRATVEEHFKLITDDFLNLDKANFYLYALEVQNNKDSNNPLTSLNYRFYDSQMSKEHICKTLNTILSYAKNKYINDTEKVFELYKPTNLKAVIDCISLSDLDFKKASIVSGTEENLDPDNYKIQYLLNSMHDSVQISNSQFKNFKKIKYTALAFFSDKHRLIVINKGNPIYKPKNILFALDSESDDFDYKPIKDALFKIPFYPGILIIDDLCLFIDDKIETLFGFTEQTKLLRDEKLGIIETNNCMSPSSNEKVHSFSHKGKNYNYFSTFDEKRLEKIKNKDAETISTLTAIGLKFEDNQPIIENENDAEKFLGYLCHVLKRDIANAAELSIALNSKKLE